MIVSRTGRPREFTRPDGNHPPSHPFEAVPGSAHDHVLPRRDVAARSLALRDIVDAEGQRDIRQRPFQKHASRHRALEIAAAADPQNTWFAVCTVAATAGRNLRYIRHFGKMSRSASLGSCRISRNWGRLCTVRIKQVPLIASAAACGRASTHARSDGDPRPAGSGNKNQNLETIMSKISLACATAVLASSGAAFAGSHLTEVSFGTNWVAQAEHGGFYQAVADGTYEECGLKVTIVPGGPQSQQPCADAGGQDRLPHGRRSACRRSRQQRKTCLWLR